MKKKVNKVEGDLDIPLKDIIANTDLNLGLDFDLSEESSLEKEHVDLLLDQGLENNYEAKVNQDRQSGAGWDNIVLSDSRDLTIRSSKRQLKGMQESKLFDAHDYQEKRIVHPGMQNPEIMNTFREIRTKLIQSSEKKNFVLMVVSLRDGMGASFCSVNVAAAFSLEGQKTSLIIDCNLRNSKLDNIFPGEYDFGLTDYLDDGDINIESILYPTGITRMRYIPIGNKRETIGEFFSSDKMSEFISQIKRRYSDRYIIINSPPVETSADAAILSDICDYILIVIPYAKISNSRLTKAIAMLPKDKIVGLVINNKA